MNLARERRAATPARGLARFVAGAGALVLVYLVAVVALWSVQDIRSGGPLSFDAAPATVAPAGATLTVDAVAARCKALPGADLDNPNGQTPSVRAGVVDGKPLFACYTTRDNGSVFGAVVLTGGGAVERDVPLIKHSGAWRWIGAIKTPAELALGAAAMLAIPAFCWFYYRRMRPGPTLGGGAWTSRWVDGLLVVLGPIGWIALGFDRARSRGRRIRLVMMSILVFFGVVVFSVVGTVGEYPDAIGWVVAGLLVAQYAFSVIAGRTQVAPDGWGAPEQAGGRAPSPAAPPPGAPAPAAGTPAASPPASSPVGFQATQAPSSPSPTAAATGAAFKVKPPQGLPTYADVGGMANAKKELAETFGMLLAYGDQADQYAIRFNGVLLHGPPGSGKTFIASATAGEYGLNYLKVSVTDIASKWVGEAAKNIEAAFATAAANIPCLLFFDEFDSIATRRGDQPDQESRRIVDQLLTSLEQYRDLHELVVMAATNDLENLDPAVVRPGRFDRQIRIDLPDRDARIGILRAQLAKRPTDPAVDLAAVADRTEGLSSATLSSMVDVAAMAAFRESTVSGTTVQITTAHLLGALAARGGKDRPTVESWSWDRLILDPSVKSELQQIQALVEHPEKARDYGVEMPSGLLLTGPPGTGKTTIARVLAAEAKTSFYPITAADLLDKWVGESEGNVKRLFARARENAPSIVFLDEIDAIGARRGESLGGFGDTMLNQLLVEIDGIGGNAGVFVMGATNRPDILDPALTRGGRLSRTIEIPLPGPDQRRDLLALFSKRMPLVDVDLAGLGARAEGLSGADLEALCQQAAIMAMTRASAAEATAPVAPSVTAADFETALTAVLATKAKRDAAVDRGEDVRTWLDESLAKLDVPTTPES